MPEHVIVTYPESRMVRVDRSPMSVTNLQFQVSAGTKIFDLGSPTDYAPPFVEVEVRGTNPNAPKTIEFTRRWTVAAAAAPPEAIASRNSDVFHVTLACPDAAKIVGANAVYGDEARAGRTLHEGCGP